MERKLVLILIALFTLSVSAEVVEIDGISYNLISKGNIAEVTGNNQNKAIERRSTGNCPIIPG